MAAVPPKKPSLLSWLFFGAGTGPGEDKSPEAAWRTRTGSKHAVKCDMCKDIARRPGLRARLPDRRRDPRRSDPASST